MSDLFSLVPEGQAWLDDQAQEKPSRPEDFEPSAFQGELRHFSVAPERVPWAWLSLP